MKNRPVRQLPKIHYYKNCNANFHSTYETWMGYLLEQIVSLQEKGVSEARIHSLLYSVSCVCARTNKNEIGDFRIEFIKGRIRVSN